MTDLSGPDRGNHLLSALSMADYGLIEPHGRRVHLKLGDTLTEPGRAVDSLYFPVTGLISLVAREEDEIEVGVVGREGVVGISAILGAGSTPLKAMCQMPSGGISFPAQQFMAAAYASPKMLAVMLKYVHTFMIQLSSTAFSNVGYTVEQRLARWLLMCHDRAEGDGVVTTHDFLATMLGVRRPGVTVATHVLEGHGLIRAKRGSITITDRGRLETFADGSYGMAEAEYAKVFGRALKTAKDVVVQLSVGQSHR